jgi:hypothetical protein
MRFVLPFGWRSQSKKVVSKAKNASSTPQCGTGSNSTRNWGSSRIDRPGNRTRDSNPWSIAQNLPRNPVSLLPVPWGGYGILGSEICYFNSTFILIVKTCVPTCISKPETTRNSVELTWETMLLLLLLQFWVTYKSSNYRLKSVGNLYIQ